MIKRLNQQFQFLIQNYPYNQHSNEWFQLRKKSITATDASAILNINPWNYPFDIINNKLFDNIDNINNDATNWGNKYEHIAKNIFQNILQSQIFNLGFVQHPIHKWLGASPDGILDDGTLIEFKCLFKNDDVEYTPPYYWIQTQIQLEVCNLDKCLLIKSKFEEEKPHEFILESQDDSSFKWYLKNYHIDTIYRDKYWFEKIFPKLDNFYQIISNKNLINFTSQDLILKINDLFKLKHTRNYFYKKDEFNNFNNFIDWKQFNSIYKIKNFILDDKLLDCLHEQNKKDDKTSFIQTFNELNNKFKSQIIILIQNKFKNQFTTILNPYEQNSIPKYIETKESINNQIPIIINPLLLDINNRIFAKPDLIIKGFILKKLIEEIDTEVIDSQYYIINIRFMNFKINLDTTISNAGNKKYYKALNIISNKLLNQELNTNNPISFIIGKNYDYKDIKINNPLKKIGIIREETLDIEIRNKAFEAYSWINNFKDDKEKDDFIKKNYYEIGFNMKNHADYPWHNLKNEIAEEKKDITKIWTLGNKNRKKLLSKGIKKWTDLRITKEIKNSKRKNLITKMIKENKRYRNNMIKLKKKDKKLLIGEIQIEKALNVFIDLEYCSSTLIDDLPNNLIFDNINIIYLIGIGYNHPETGEWIYHKIYLKDFNLSDNSILFNSMNEYLFNLLQFFPQFNNICLFHWNHVEKSIYDKFTNFDENLTNKLIWKDLLKIVKEYEIVFKGVFSFGLKNYANLLYERGFIKTKWIDDINGLSSIDLIRKVIKETNNQNIETHQTWNNIVKYNEIDCKVLMEIREFLINL
jgi:putative phage-type endonuclease